MSKTQATSQEDIREQFRRTVEPWEKSAQAKGTLNAPVSQRPHYDGATIYQDWGARPFDRWLDDLTDANHQIAKYPGALLDCVLHLGDTDLERLEAGDSFDDLEGHHDIRRNVLQWCQEPSLVKGKATPRHDALTHGGTDCHLYGPPRRGKTTMAQNIADWLMQLNNETILWSENIGRDGKIERTQWLPFASYATLALPEGLDVAAKVVPENHAIQPFTVSVDQCARRIVRYDSPRDLVKKLVPGEFTVVFPDPRFRGCEQISRFPFTSAWDAEEPGDATPQAHWWFAMIAERISGRQFNHWVSVFIDEAGNWLEEEAEKDEHQTLQKIEYLRDKYADAAKHKTSIFPITHAMVEIHHKIRRKVRWWLTINGGGVPIGKKLPGNRQAPQKYDIVNNMEGRGTGQIWTPVGGRYANVASNPTSRAVPLQGDVVFSFPEVAEAYAN